MDLKILGILLLYWALWIGISYAVFSNITVDTTVTASLNSSAMGAEELESGGLFTTGVSLARFAGFVLFGVGLPSAMPTLVAYLLAIFQSCVTIFTVGFVISAIWNG